MRTLLPLFSLALTALAAPPMADDGSNYGQRHCYLEAFKRSDFHRQDKASVSANQRHQGVQRQGIDCIRLGWHQRLHPDEACGPASAVRPEGSRRTQSAATSWATLPQPHNFVLGQKEKTLAKVTAEVHSLLLKMANTSCWVW